MTWRATADRTIEIYREVVANTRAAISPPGDRDLTPADIAGYQLAGMQTLWDARFFHRDLSEILVRDPEMAADYGDFRNWIISGLLDTFRRLIHQGVMHPPRRKADLERVATNVYILWTSWLTFKSNAQPGRRVVRRDALEGALHAFLIVEPYLDEGFATRVRSTIQKGT